MPNDVHNARSATKIVVMMPVHSRCRAVLTSLIPTLATARLGNA